MDLHGEDPVHMDNEFRNTIPLFTVQNGEQGLTIFTDVVGDSVMGLANVTSAALAADTLRVQQHSPHTLQMVVDVRRRGAPVSGDIIGSYSVQCTVAGSQLSYRCKGFGKGPAAKAKAGGPPPPQGEPAAEPEVLFILPIANEPAAVMPAAVVPGATALRDDVPMADQPAAEED